MDLSYPPAVQASLDRIGQALTDISVKDELQACAPAIELWASAATTSGAAPAAGPLAQVAEFRALGAYAIPLAELLAKANRAYVPLPAGASLGASTLGWPDASAPWQNGDLLTTELKGGTLTGSVSVAPFCAPATSLILMAQEGSDMALVAITTPPKDSSLNAQNDKGIRAERSGDAFTVTLAGARATVLARGPEAIAAWERAVLWERLALLGLTLGLIDRCWRSALDALCEGKRAGNILADEQVAQFQLADNDIERLSAQNLIFDAAVDADHGKASARDKVALVRYYTSCQAERCAARALHVAQLFTPRVVPIARWFVQRAHHLATFSAAREHEVRAASAGVIAGLSLE